MQILYHTSISGRTLARPKSVWDAGNETAVPGYKNMYQQHAQTVATCYWTCLLPRI